MRRDLEELEQRWGLAVQSASFGVWDLDVLKDTVHYPPQWKAMLGYDDADVADPTAAWRGRVHPDDLQPMLTALFDHLSGRHPTYEKEFRLRAADGSYRWVLSRGRVVERDAQGAALRAIGTLTDCTDRRHAERLRVERDRAEAASRAKTEFLTRMSHELRTPLNAVLGFAQLLSKRTGTANVEEDRRYIAHIEKAGWHLLQMIDDVLDLSSMENGRASVQLGPVALAPLVQTVSEAMAESAQQRDVEVLPAVLPSHARVQADPARLQQVLSILLSNAVKYNRKGGSVAVEVCTAPQAWKLSVIDTGIGISPSQMVHLFEPFNRLGRGNSSGVDGVGIGLALARSLVEAMGGRLTVQSAPAVGSKFELTLPAATS
jgi:PAS domain S-box-containing protein